MVLFPSGPKAFEKLRKLSPFEVECCLYTVTRNLFVPRFAFSEIPRESMSNSSHDGVRAVKGHLCGVLGPSSICSAPEV